MAATLVVAIAFFTGGGLLYLFVSAALTRDVAERTELAARRVAGAATEGLLRQHLLRASEGGDHLQVVAEDGRVISWNTLLVQERPIADFRPQGGRDSASRTIAAPWFSHGHRAEVVVVRAETQDGPVLVYAAATLAQADRAAGTILLALAISAPLFISIVAAVTWWATRRAFRPVEAIRAELAAITARALDHRVPEPPTGDEVADLARTVNRTLDRLDQSVARQRQFVSDASHELRNPIAALLVQLEVALSETDPKDPVRPVINDALTDTKRLQTLADDLLLLAVLDTEARRGHAPVDIGLMAAEVVAHRRHNRVPIKLDIADDVQISGDARQLSRLVANLLSNAQRHADSAVTVRVTSDDTAEQAILEVADDGPGLPAADRERIFERFTRLDQARDRETGGVGLGLAIARDIAQAHAGTLKVEESERGARFVARLPPLGSRSKGESSGGYG